MKLKKIYADFILNSRKEKTIRILVKTSKGIFKTSAPSGKSKGIFEAKVYHLNLEGDIEFINKINLEEIQRILDKYFLRNFKNFKINAFLFLKDLEKFLKNKLGANSLFSLEACFLKAIAKEKNKELWEFLLDRDFNIDFYLKPVGNAIGGGKHSNEKSKEKPDFQEFLFIPESLDFFECVKLNKIAYSLAKKMLKARKRNDEGAWKSSLNNEEIIKIMKKIQEIIRKKYKQEIKIGLDIASSEFYKVGHYIYKNPDRKLNSFEQLEFISDLINKYSLFYIEDPLNEKDFLGFKKLRTNVKDCLIVGDDLTVTNPKRLEKAIRMKAINAVILKPNQIGSLVEFKKAIEIAKKYNIKTIISHRSGETTDNTIADLAVGFQCDFIKTGIYSKFRTSKLKRLIMIQKKFKNLKR